MLEQPDDLLTYEEAAQEIGLTLGSLKQVIGRGLLHPVKVPRQRRKFLRREEVSQYRDGKEMDRHPEDSFQAPRSDDPATKPLLDAMSRQEITEGLQSIILEANKAWEANAAAYQASVAAYQASAVAIRDGLISTLQVFYTAITGETGWPQFLGEFQLPTPTGQERTDPKEKASADPGGGNQATSEVGQKIDGETSTGGDSEASEVDGYKTLEMVMQELRVGQPKVRAALKALQIQPTRLIQDKRVKHYSPDDIRRIREWLYSHE